MDVVPEGYEEFCASHSVNRVEFQQRNIWFDYCVIQAFYQ